MFSFEEPCLMFSSEQDSLIFFLALNKLVLCLALNKLVLVLALNKPVSVLKTRNIYHTDLLIILLGFSCEQASCYDAVQVVYVDCNPICGVEWLSCGDLKF